MIKTLLIILFPLILFAQFGERKDINISNTPSVNVNSIPNVDDHSQSAITIDFPHHEVHEGDHFYIAGFSDIGNGDSIWFSTTTPNDSTWIHMKFDIESTTILSFYIYEGATVTDGNTLTPWNNNRRSGNSSELVVVSSPVIVANGTCIDSTKWGTAGGVNKSGGEASRERELILAKNTTYLWVAVSGAASNIVSYYGGWYEHDNP